MNRFTPIVAGLLLAGAYPSLAGDLPVMAEQAQLMTHLKHIVGTADDGRSPGSPTSIKAINYSDAKLKEYGFKTYRQDFVWGDTTKLGPVNPNHAIFIPADYKTRKCTNIIALKAGEDPKFKDHFIVLIAHTDGQGKGVASELVPSAAIVAGAKDPKSATPLLLTGANDNASCVGTFLHIASQLQRVKMKRSLLILLVDAEEVDLDPRRTAMGLGSRYFIRHPVIPGAGGGTVPLALENIEAVLNCELVGNESKALITIGSNFISQDLDDVVKSTARALGRTLDTSLSTKAYAEKTGTYWNASDHTHFARLGIPSVLISAMDGTSSAKRHYHTPNDSLENIDPAAFLKNAKFFKALLLALDRRDTLLAHDRDWGVAKNPTEHPFYRGTTLKRVPRRPGAGTKP